LLCSSLFRLYRKKRLQRIQVWNLFYFFQWLNECKYIQKFDNKKNKLTEEMKMINEDGGIVIEFLNKEDDKCINYQSYVKKFKKMSLRKGKFCTK
jgi:hypothetical protein